MGNVCPARCRSWTAVHPSDVIQGQHADVTPWHVYHIAAVDPGTGLVKVHNVWDGGSTEIDMPLEDFQKAFQGVHVNPVK